MLKLKHLFTFALFVQFSLTFSQKGTHSPYSIFGIGELNTNQYAGYAAMAGVGMANTDSTMINQMNPASYSYLHRHKPVFQVGMNGRLSRFETSATSTDQRHFGLNQFQLGLPIKKRWGAAFGVKPYSFSGYTVSNYVVEEGDTTQQFINEGSGGISMVYLGVSAMPIKKSMRKPKIKDGDTLYVVRSSHKLSLGVNGNYLFGSAIRKRSFEYVWPILGWNSRVEKSLRVSDFMVDFGVNYEYLFQSDSTGGAFSFGAAYSPGRSVRAFEDLLSYTYSGSFYNGLAPSITDTIEHVLDNQGTIRIPESYKVGLEYRIGPKRNKSSVVRIGADIKYQRWSTYSENFGSSFDNNLKDRLSLSAALEWTPQTIVTARSNSSSFLSRIHYRIGFDYTQTELQVLNSQEEFQSIDDYGMSFGLGIPVGLMINSNTNINFGAKFGKLGTTDNGLIQERYIGLYFGLSITPGRGNYWFVKRKYN
ncbi:MAG: hypothetical protein MI810_11755 [Flavobacteriales bacterium]|nr:hypothetical protein [Flavobacteriales bacterium]